MKNTQSTEKRTVKVSIDKQGNIVGDCTECGTSWTIKEKSAPKSTPPAVACPSGCPPQPKAK